MWKAINQDANDASPRQSHRFRIDRTDESPPLTFGSGSHWRTLLDIAWEVNVLFSTDPPSAATAAPSFVCQDALLPWKQQEPKLGEHFLELCLENASKSPSRA